MYSNKINAFSFFIILCFAPMISVKGSQLSVNHYRNTCPGLQNIVTSGVATATMSKSRTPASLLRLQFHDCFVIGCEASVLLDGPNGEQNANPNKNSVLGLDVIDNIKAEVEKICPNTVSCADILALAARAAVAISLGNDLLQPWKVVLGRLDGLDSNLKGANRDIPSPLDSVDSLITKFEAKGLKTQDMVALSGGHTIGLSKCSSFKSRLYASNSTKIMDAGILTYLRNKCRNDKSSDNNTVPLDMQSPTKFDNKYYINIENKAGVLQSDQALASDVRTLRWVNKYKAHPQDFLNDFGNAMERLGTIGVITDGKKGQIRKKCGFIN